VSWLEPIVGGRQAAEIAAICAYYHLFKLAGNLIDPREGVIEHRVSQLLARRLIRHFRFEVEVDGLEHVPPPRERYAVVCSHASYLDWAILLGHFPSPLRFVAKRELARWPVIGDFLRLRGVLIDRGRGRDALTAIREAARDGQPWPILLFPEGTRSHDGTIGAFRRGGMVALAEAGLTLLPVAITGTFEAFPRQARAIRPGGRIALRIGAPVRPADPEELEARVALCESRVRALARRPA
jgi:1-acyl-sn-glycerol-3-phosphate acyltransferase